MSTYDLPALIRASKVKPRSFRRILPTEALRGSIAAPYFGLIRAWQAERSAMLATYAALLPDRGDELAPDATETIQRQTDASAAKIAVALAVLLLQFRPALSRFDRWHEGQWVNRIETATGIDVKLFTGPLDTRAALANSVAWNEQLARQVHLDIRGAVTSRLTGGLAAREPAARVGTGLSDLLLKQKRRVARIGVDQTDGLAEELSRVRRVAANLVRFRWHHDNDQPHPRKEHAARDKRIYTPRTAPNDRAGTLPFCRCWEEPLWD